MADIFEVPQPGKDLLEKADQVRLASISISQTENQNRIKALNFMADYLEKNTKEILEANNEDYTKAEKKGISKALLSRLKLSNEKLNSGIDGVRKVGDLADPINQVQIKRELSQGLILERKTVPIGVIGVIFESRPDSYKPCCKALTIAMFVKLASLPPFSITPFPDLIARELICITASGLDSKITPRTPIGSVFLSKISPLESSLFI